MTTKPVDLGVCSATWLIVADSGGWLKASEIAQALGVAADTIHQRLANMVAANYLARRTIPAEKRVASGRMGPYERAEYGVLKECIVPRGIPAGEVAKALGLALQP